MGCSPESPEASSFLDLETGAVFVVLDDTAAQLQALLADTASDVPIETASAHYDAPDWEKQALREAWHIEQHRGERLAALADAGLREEYRDLEAFIATVQDAAVRAQLERAVNERAAFRRFREVIRLIARRARLRRTAERAFTWRVQGQTRLITVEEYDSFGDACFRLKLGRA